MAEMVSVEMLRSWERWNATERCGFPAQLAERLVLAGFAKKLEDKASAKVDALSEPAPAVKMHPVVKK